jgi:hypothetical protein
MDLLNILAYLFVRIRENIITLLVVATLSIYLWRLLDHLYARSSTASIMENRLFNKHSKYNFKILILTLVLVLFSLVHVVNMLIYYGSFKEPDPYTNTLDVQTIVKNGHIPSYPFNRFTYLVDTYYSSFPVFIILLSVLNIVLGSDIYSMYFFVHAIFLVILMIYVLIFIRNIINKTFYWTPLVLLAGMASSLYFYGALGTFVPSRLGLIILVLILFIYQRHDNLRIEDIIVLVLLSIGALIHATIPITSMLLLLSSWIINIFLLKKKKTSHSIAILLILIPFVVYIVYSSYALGGIINVLRLLWLQLTMSVEYSETASPGYPKSALTQFTRGLNLAFSLVLPFIASLEFIRRRQRDVDNKANTFVWILSIIGYSYTLIAVINYVIYGRPVFGSYFLVVASFLMGFASSTVLIKILENTKKAVHIYMLIVLLAISFIGVTADPYVYKTPSYSWYLDLTNQMKMRVWGKVLISSSINEVQIMSSDQSSCVLKIKDYLSFIIHYYYDTSIELKELKCYFTDNNSNFTHLIFNDGTFLLV